MKETFLQSFPDRATAASLASQYARALLCMPDPRRYGMRVAHLPSGRWAVYLRDKQAG